MLSRFLIVTGSAMIFASLYLYSLRLKPTRLAISSYTAPFVAADEKVQPAKQPVGIKIARVGVELPIIPSKITDSKWETSAEGVSFLMTSPIPGEQGNSILYGHNWENLLGPLVRVEPGDTIEIIYIDGSSRSFRIEYTATVPENQIGILNETSDVRLTIYTCTGFLDSERFVAVAFPL